MKTHHRIREHLDIMVEETDEEVIIGDDSAHPVKGVGTCTIKLNFGFSIQFVGVLHVPGTRRNLVSILPLKIMGIGLPL